MKDFFPLETGKSKELKNAVDNKKNCAVFFAHQTNRCHIAVNLQKPFLFIVSDLISAQKTVEILSEYTDKEIALMPEREDVLIDRKVENFNSVYDRINILNKLINNQIYGLVITIEGLIQLYPDVNLFKEHTVFIKKNQDININSITEKLVSCGYKRVPLLENSASFSLRGDILDIFPIGQSAPLRIELFGDNVEAIKVLDLDTMLCSEEKDSIDILPASDFIINNTYVDTVINSFLRDIKNSKQKFGGHYESLAQNFRLRPSASNNTFFLPYLREKFSTIYSYLPNDAVIIFDDVKLIDDKLQLLTNSFYSRVKELIKDNKALPIHKNSVFDKEDLYNFSHSLLGFGKITSSVPIFEPDEIFSIKTQNVPRYHMAINELYTDLKNYAITGFTVRIFAKDTDKALALQQNFNENMLAIPINDLEKKISIVTGNINFGFIYLAEKLVVMGIKDYSRPLYQSKSFAQKKAVFSLPEKGDYVVHVVHGIGISEGMQKVETSSGIKDFYVILYREGGRLYLPANQLNTIEKYNGADAPRLHKLGGAEFERIKAKVKNSVKEMAIDLLSLYQSRFNKKGYVYPEDSIYQSEMENDFEYTLTDDQLIAVNEIKNDLEKGKIMDRLLCGDVGFGKTEVAMRAMFKVVMENKQVVMLAPTTILAQQHYNLIRERFNKYGITVGLLSRFVPPETQKQVLKQLVLGKINVLVATHRVLSKDVKFFDLGLLILDEEQRFGVEQKERLKVFKNKVNILSLSATPIPRTLHMSLSGIRDISTIDTPPKNRLPVQTYVTEYTDNLLISAVNKETGRGGKVFILYNRVAGIEKWYSHIKSILPSELNIIMAHGQMPEEMLERNITDFYEGKAEILLSTTIIENGIDLPDANTLFVIDSDNLGLGQLYQLRGRVGRSDTLAYAYFTIRENKVLSENAKKRLDALMENTELGSGFKIAMRDLEIRGAGNVLGKEQSGQMGKVGYDMYLKLIKEGIDELKGNAVSKYTETKIVIDGDYHLDDTYITTPKERVAFYRFVSLLQNREEARTYQKKLEETYGKLPNKIMDIIRIGLIKNIANKLNVKTVTILDKGCGLEFYDNSPLSNEGLIGSLSDYNQYAVLIPTEPPSVIFNTKNMQDKSKIKLVLDFLANSASE